jgi:von Willebrand factor type A domain/TIR domain
MWLILLDRSESMGRPFTGTGEFPGRTRRSEAAVKLEAAKQAIVDHLRGLAAPARVVVIAFNNTAKVVYDGPSSTQAEIEQAIDPIQASGGTNTAAALSLAAATVDAAPDERLFRAFVVTDGEDDLAPAAAAATALASHGVIIDVTLIDPTPKGDAVARAIARDGTVSAVASAQELHEQVGRAKAAQEQQHADVQAVIARHDQERAQLAKERPVEERLAFTAAYVPDIATQRWYPLVVYLHLAALQDEVARAIREEAGAGASLPSLSLARATRGVARGTPLTLTPQVEGLQFNPPSATVAWFEDIQDVRFRFRAPADRVEQSVFGALEVTLGSLPIAHLGIAINVRAAAIAVAARPMMPQHTGVYQDVFASYSSGDAAIVQACRAVYWGLGIHLAVDKQTLRAGQEWDPALRAIIEKCDLFQLFWSEAASKSIPVRHEYESALRHLPTKGPGFLRPVVWEVPPPQIPPDLKRFHFAPLDLAALARFSNLPIAAVSCSVVPPPPPRNGRVPVAAVPLIPGAAPDLVQSVHDDLSEAVRFLEGATGLRYYPVPTLLVDEHVVRTVRAHETIDLGPIDSQWVDLADALQNYLLAIGLQLHVGGLVPGKRSQMTREEYAARFGTGRLVSLAQFEWVRGASEAFPQISDVLANGPRKAMRAVGKMIQRPQLALDLAAFIPLLLELGADAVEGDDPRRLTSVGDRDWTTVLAPDLTEAFVKSGGSVVEGRGLSLRGPARSFAALLRSVGALLSPLLSVVQGYDGFRSDPPPPEAAPVRQLCALAARVLHEVPSSHPLWRDAHVTEMARWLDDLFEPRWRVVGKQLSAEGLAGEGRMDTLHDVLQVFLGIVEQLLDHGLRASGDFDLAVGFGIPEEAWTRIVADLGGHALTIGERTTDPRGGLHVRLTGRFSHFVDLYHKAAARLVSLSSSAPRQRSVTQRVFVEMSPTFGIFVPARSESTDRTLQRWASEQGIAQAVTLPGADRVLLCLDAADRFAAKLREGASDPAQAQRMAVSFQRCVLVHEHFHAIVACGVDVEGRSPAGPSLPEAWSKARTLNEALAVWMELHYVRGNAAMERLVWDYIGAGAYPEWPYAGASRLEAQYTAGGIDVIQSWIVRLRSTPEIAQQDFDR